MSRLKFGRPNGLVLTPDRLGIKEYGGERLVRNTSGFGYARAIRLPPIGRVIGLGIAPN